MNTEHTAVADMMSGLMMVFLFVAVVFMLNQQGMVKTVEAERDDARARKQELEGLKRQLSAQNAAMRHIAEVAEQSRVQINRELNQAFAEDLTRWGAQVLADNTVRFNAPEVLFETGRAELTPRYRAILDEFFPRYAAIIYGHRNEIEAIRIEGHTSSEWQTSSDEQERFLRNMGLSQLRALQTLTYGYHLIANPELTAWLRGALMANGRSFGAPVQDATGSEDARASRRVEFKLVTRAEERLYEILDQARQGSG